MRWVFQRSWALMAASMSRAASTVSARSESCVPEARLLSHSSREGTASCPRAPPNTRRSNPIAPLALAAPHQESGAAAGWPVERRQPWLRRAPEDLPDALLDAGGSRRLADGGWHKNLRGIDRVKAVLLPAELAAHLDVFAFGEDALGFFDAQVAQHVAHTFTAAGAGKPRAAGALLGLEAQQLFLPEQAAQDSVHVQGQQP